MIFIFDIRNGLIGCLDYFVEAIAATARMLESVSAWENFVDFL